MPDAKTVQASIGMERGSLETRVRVRHHEFGVDEAPPRYDSVDAHPDPYDYLLAAVASCTAISVRLSAEAKGFPLEGVDVEASFRRRAPESEGGQPDHISRSITLHGPLSAVERTKLLRAADCAAYRSVSTGIPISTELAPSSQNEHVAMRSR